MDLASRATKLIIPNDEMVNLIKIVKSLEHSGFLKKWVTQTVQNEVKKQNGGFLNMLLRTLGTSLLRKFINR